MKNAFRSTVALAIVLAFNCGARAAPSQCDDDADVALVSPRSDSSGESFGQRMADARAKKHKAPKGAKGKRPVKHHARKTGSKLPKEPRAPKVPTIADGF